MTAANFASLGPRLLRQGFEPIPVAGKRPALKGWESVVLHPDQVEIWATGDKAALNVGLRTTTLAPIDVDIYDEAVAARVVASLVSTFGVAPQRIGAAPKMLLLYAAAEPGTKITSPFWTSPDGVDHRVEVLGIGQQFVAAGIHPDTRQPYRWVGENIADLERWMLPSIDRAAAAAWVCDVLPSLLPADWVLKVGASGGAGFSDDPFDSVKAPHEDVDLAALVWMLDHLEQDRCDDRDSWRNVIFAVHHQFHGTEQEEAALDALDVWSSKSVKYVGGVVQALWEAAHEQRGGGLVTIGTLKSWLGDGWRGYCAQRKASSACALVEDQGIEASILAADLATLEGVLIPEIKAMDLTIGVRAQLTATVRDRFRALCAPLPLDTVRRMLTPPRATEDIVEPVDMASWASLAPAWAQEWIWVRTEAKFLHRTRKIRITKDAFNTEMARHVPDLLEEENGEMREFLASERMFKKWGAVSVDKEAYHPALGEVFTMGGLTYANKYRPELRIVADTAWTDDGRKLAAALDRHLALLVPDDGQRAVLKSWLAYQYLHPGTKVRWAPLIKGCPGDGKTMLGELLERVLGLDNVRLMNADTIQTSPFSGWVEGQCVTVFEEVKFQGHNRHDVVNRLKPYVSNNRVEKHGKGLDPSSIWNVTNYLLLTNHEDAIPIEQGDRRFYILFSPFKTLAGMDKVLQDDYLMTVEEHFEEVWSLVRGHVGQLALWLAETVISPEFNPNMAALMTDAKRSMSVSSQSDAEAAVLDILDDVKHDMLIVGVTENVLSLTHLRAELRRRMQGAELASRTVSSVLRSSGYQPAPGGEPGKALKVMWNHERVSVWARDGVATCPKSIKTALDGTTTELFND